jgi:hypothetical protein
MPPLRVRYQALQTKATRPLRAALGLCALALALSLPRAAAAGGSVVAWGDMSAGGDYSAVEPQLRAGVISVQTTDRAMAALKEDGSVVAWGDPASGGDLGTAAPSLTSGVVKIFSCSTAFAALKSDGSVVTWGGTGGNSSPVSDQLASGVTDIVPNKYAFAAIKSNGSVVTWGGYGGNSSTVAAKLASGVVKVVATEQSFAALKTDGSMVWWGYSFGSPMGQPIPEVAALFTSGITEIFSNNLQFAALKTDGSLLMAGNLWPAGIPSSLAAKLASGVEQVVAAGNAMTAFKANGETVCWNSRNGVEVFSPLIPGPVKKVVTSESQFVAVLESGQALGWHASTFAIANLPTEQMASGVTDAFGARFGIRMVKTGGTIVPWGETPSYVISSITGAAKLHGNPFAWAILKTDGTVQAQGSIAHGGNNYGVSRELASGPVSEIFAGPAAFAALIETPRIFVDSPDFVENLPPDAAEHRLSVPMGSAGETFTYSLVAGQGDSGNTRFAIEGSLLKPLSLDHETLPVTSVRVRATGSASTVAEGVLHLRVLDDPEDDAPVQTYGVRAFGNYYEAGDASAVAADLQYGVLGVEKTTKTFAAVKNGGPVIVWRNGEYGGNQADVPEELALGVKKVVTANNQVFALNPFGRLFAWGGYNSSPPVVHPVYNPSMPDLSHGIADVVTNGGAHAAITASGRIITWGNESGGGSTDSVAEALEAGCKQIIPVYYAGFLVLTNAGKVVAIGGMSANSDPEDYPTLASGIIAIETMGKGFAATRSDGSKFVWGTGFDATLNALPATRVRKFIGGSAEGYSVLKDDGSVTWWRGYTSDVVEPDPGDIGSGVVDLFTSGAGFAALKSDGSVVVWGDATRGGSAPGLDLTGVARVVPGSGCFAALKHDGSVVSWGFATNGGDSSSVTAELSSGVARVVPAPYGLLAVKANGRLVIWGQLRSSIDLTALEEQAQGRVADVVPLYQSIAVLVSEPPPFIDWKAEPLVENRPGGTSAGRLSVLARAYGENYRFSLVAGNGDRDNSLFRISGDRLLAAAPLDHESVSIARVRIRLDGDQGSTTEKAILIRIDNDPSDDLRKGHRVVSWGLAHAGGSQGTVAGSLTGGVAGLVAAKENGFTAIKTNGSVVSWGSDFSDTPVPGLGSGVSRVFVSDYSGAVVLKEDGSVVLWPNASYDLPTATDAAALQAGGVVDAAASSDGFAVIRRDGSVVSWGSQNSAEANVAARLKGGVVKVFANDDAFAALKWDGSLVVWGSYSGNELAGEGWKLTGDVVDVVSARNSFAALKNDGSAVSWGNYIGNYAGIVGNLASNVVSITTTTESFAALKGDGSVVTWGSADRGGNSSAVAAQLSSGVGRIYANGFAFAALKSNGAVVTWGMADYGGAQGAAASALSSGVTDIAASGWAFAARKSNGSVTWWGYLAQESQMSGSPAALTSGVVSVVGCDSAFAAIKSDGSAIAWGAQMWGGDASAVSSLLKGVTQIQSTGYAFAALIPDPSIEPGEVEIAENLPANTLVATLVAKGLKAGETATFTLAPGQSASITGYFKISGNKLQLKVPLDFEALPLLDLRLNATGNQGTVATSTLRVSVTDSPTDNWTAWLNASGLTGINRSPIVDPDGDGIVNAIEYATARDPLSRDQSQPLTLQRSGNYYRAEFLRSRNAHPSDPLVKYGDGLADWKTATHGVGGVSIDTFTEVQPGVDRVVVWLPASTSGRMFARLVVTDGS